MVSNLVGKIDLIIKLARYCNFSHPQSGCVISDLKRMGTTELLTHLFTLNEGMVDRIVSYHEACPYRDRVPI